MGKINRKAITSKKVEVSKSKSDASTVADKGAKVSKRSKESGVISLGVKKTATMTAGARLRKKDRVKVKKQHLLLKLQADKDIKREAKAKNARAAKPMGDLKPMEKSLDFIDKLLQESDWVKSNSRKPSIPIIWEFSWSTQGQREN